MLRRTPAAKGMLAGRARRRHGVSEAVEAGRGRLPLGEPELPARGTEEKAPRMENISIEPWAVALRMSAGRLSNMHILCGNQRERNTRDTTGERGRVWKYASF